MKNQPNQPNQPIAQERVELQRSLIALGRAGDRNTRYYRLLQRQLWVANLALRSLRR